MSTPSIERVRTPCRAWTVILAAALAATTGCAVDALSSDVLSIAPSEDGAVPFWPPVVGERYPDLELLDQTGRRMRLSELSGRPILLEPVGMSCPACQAFSGAHRDGVGPFGDVRPQQGLGSIDEYIEPYAGLSAHDPRFVLVQLLLYDTSARAAPSPADGRRWASHFDMRTGDGRLVLVASAEMIGPASHAMIPGFQLIDRDFVLRLDSAGHDPPHDLWSELLPELGRMVRESPAPTGAAGSPREGTRVGEKMPELTLADAGGDRRSLSSIRGGSSCFLYFYSGCCGHCSEQLPRLGPVARRHEAAGAAVVGVEYLGDATSCGFKREEYDLPGTILADSDGSVCDRLDVGDFTVFLLDESGVIRYRGPLQRAPAPSDG